MNKSSTYCAIAEMTLNFDMCGMISPCQETNFWLKMENLSMANVLDHDLTDVFKTKMRQEFLETHRNGERHPNCSHCWEREDQGVLSIRQIHNDLLVDVEILEDQPRILVIKPSNKCNNACRSCNAPTSSLWYKDEYALESKGKTFKVWLEDYKTHAVSYKNNTKLEQKLTDWSNKIIFWDLYGGEPLIVPLSFKIIKDAVASGDSKHQMLGIHTNGTVYDPELVTLFKEFKSVSLAISIDAAGPRNNYVRYGSEWDSVLSILEKYKHDIDQHDNMSLTIRYSPTVLNLYYLDEFYEVINEDYKHVNVSIENMITDKPYNDIRYIPPAVKEIVRDKLLNSPYIKNNESNLEKVENVLKFMMQDQPDFEEHRYDFKNHQRALDTLRNENIEEVMPEWYNVLRQHDFI